MLCRDHLVKVNASEGVIENGVLFFGIIAAAVLLALEICPELSIDIDCCRGRGLDF